MNLRGLLRIASSRFEPPHQQVTRHGGLKFKPRWFDF
jgi:hypothetical protein